MLPAKATGSRLLVGHNSVNYNDTVNKNNKIIIIFMALDPHYGSTRTDCGNRVRLLV